MAMKKKNGKPKMAKSGGRKVIGSAMSPAKAGRVDKANKLTRAAQAKKKTASQMKAFKKKYRK